MTRGPDGPEYSMFFDKNLDPVTRDKVVAHEFGHLVDELSGLNFERAYGKKTSVMSTSDERRTVKTVFPPSVMEGGSISRAVELDDGSGRIESWTGSGWRVGGARWSEFFTAARPATADELAAAGIVEDEEATNI